MEITARAPERPPPSTPTSSAATYRTRDRDAPPVLRRDRISLRINRTDPVCQHRPDRATLLYLGVNNKEPLPSTLCLTRSITPNLRSIANLSEARLQSHDYSDCWGKLAPAEREDRRQSALGIRCV